MFETIRTALRRSKPVAPSGESVVTGGLPGVAALESRLTDAVCLGSGFPAILSLEGFPTGGRNAFGDSVGVHQSSGDRGVLAMATGLTLSGLRTTVFLGANEAEQSSDLLSRAVARQLPLVVHLVGGGASRQGLALGADHSAAHLLASTGAVVLHPQTVQEALDLTLVAHRVAESLLVPVVVVQDDYETALALQDARMPDDALLTRMVGQPGDMVESVSPAQRLVYGAERRRVPRRHDAERPTLESPFLDGTAFALAGAATHGFHARHLGKGVEEAMETVGAATGRPLHAVVDHQADGAEILFVASGATGQTLQAAVDHARGRKLKAGSATLRQISPFPAVELARRLRRVRHLVVLDRCLPGPEGDGPLSLRIRSMLDRCSENHAAGSPLHEDLPPLDPSRRPRLHAVFHGAGGHPLRVNDVATLAGRITELSVGPVFLGVGGSDTDGQHPKREVLLDRLRRDDPGAMEFGIRSTDPVPRSLPPEALVIEVHRRGAGGSREVLHGMASLLHTHQAGMIQGRTDLSWDPRSEGEVDRLILAPTDTPDPGHGVPVDVVIWESPRVAARLDAAARLAQGGLFILPAADDEDPLADRLLPELRSELILKEARVYVATGRSAKDMAAEHLLGAVTGVLSASGLVELTAQKASTLRSRELDSLEDAARRIGVTAFETGFASVKAVDPLPSVGSESSRGVKPVPPRLRRVDVPTSRLDSPARFEEQAGAFYRTRQQDLLSPDPYLALGTLPPRTSCQDIVLGEDMIPVFNPDPCTGCGACWSECPDGAITATILGAQDLLEHGMSRVRETGESAEVLRMVLPKLVAGVAKATGSGPAGPMLTAAFEQILTSGKLAGDREPELRRAFDRVHAVVEDVPLTRTDVYFDRRETARRGTGRFLSLAVDPDICRGCSLCVQACEPNALTRTLRTQTLVAEAVDTTYRVGSLPPVAAATLEAMRDEPELHSLAAPMLDQIGNPLLTGGGAGEPGSGERLVARQILATAADHLRPARARRVKQVEEVELELRTRIQALLAGTLPTRDLDALSAGLRDLDSTDVDLASLASRVEPAFNRDRVDRAELERLVASARELEELRRRLTVGDNGLGRSLLALVGAPGGDSMWMGTFPDNPFAVPVELDPTGRAVDTARGIWEGHLRDDLEGVRALRRARCCLDAPAEAEREEQRLADLAWHDLTADERELVAPVVLMGTENALAGSGFAGLCELFTEGIPIKILAFVSPQSWMGGATGPVTPAETSASFHGDLGLVALAHPRVFVLQTSLAHPEMTAAGVSDALCHGGPALIRVYAPSPWRDGYAPENTLDRARHAVVTRTVPLLRRNGVEVLGAGSAELLLENNPLPEEDWAAGRQTPGHWAAGEARSGAFLSPLPEEDPREAVLLADYVDLSLTDRENRVPVVMVDGDSQTLVASERMVRFTEERLWNWRELRRLAAASSGVTRAQHDAELEELNRRHQSEIETTRATVEAAMTERLRNRLRTLVTRVPSNGGKGA